MHSSKKAVADEVPDVVGGVPGAVPAAPHRPRHKDRRLLLYLAAALVTVRLLVEIRLIEHRRFSTDKVEKVAQQNRVRGGPIHRPVGQRTGTPPGIPPLMPPMHPSYHASADRQAEPLKTLAHAEFQVRVLGLMC